MFINQFQLWKLGRSGPSQSVVEVCDEDILLDYLYRLSDIRHTDSTVSNIEEEKEKKHSQNTIEFLFLMYNIYAR